MSNVTQNVDCASREAKPTADRMIVGWLSERFEKGETPSYGYPKNHLPSVPKSEMTVAPSFSTKVK